MFILDGSSEHVAPVCRKSGLFREKISNSGCSRSEQIPLTDQKPEIIPPISELLSKTSNIPHTEACFQIYFFSINLKDCVQPV